MEIVIPTTENPCLECNDLYMNNCVKSSYCMKFACYQVREQMINSIRELNLGIDIVRVKDGSTSADDR